MLYVKLIIRNVRRSIKQYAIFMMTISISMMLMYAFNGVMLSEEIMTLSKHMDSMMQMFLFASVIIICILGWLVNYISRYILKNRSSEFGLYLLMGMKRKQLSRMFVLEMFCMGFLALIIGCVLGIFFYQLLYSIILHVFSMHVSLQLHFSGKAALLTFVYFLVMWFITLWRERHFLKHISIHDLFYEHQKNEKIIIHRGKVICFMTIFLGTLLYGFWLTNDGMTQILYQPNGTTKSLMLGILCLIISIYAFFSGMFRLLAWFMQKHPRFKYKKQYMLLYGHSRSRLRSNRRVFATISMLSIITLLLVCFGLKFQDASLEQVNIMNPYDIIFYDELPIQTDLLHEYLDDKQFDYEAYTAQQYELNNFTSKLPQEMISYHESLTFMKESDFKALLQLLGKQQESLQDGEYGISVSFNYRKYLNELTHLQLQKDQQQYVCSYVDQNELGFLYEGIVIILQDQEFMNEKAIRYQHVVQTNQETTVGMQEEIIQLLSTKEHQVYGFVKADNVNTTQASLVTITFSLYYIAFIFVSINATILAVQQLMDIDEQKHEYALLSKLGMRKRELNRLLWKQIGMYFLIPLLLPAVYIVPAAYIMNRMFIMLPGMISMYPILIIASLIYLLVYCCYFVITYSSAKRTIE